MAGVESLNLFGNALLVALQIGLAGYGFMLAIGRSRLTSPFTVQPAGVRRSRITGVLLVIGQLLGLLLVTTAGQPSSTLALAPAVVAGLVGWILDGLLPGGRPGGEAKSN
jgi:hypothetical protein